METAVGACNCPLFGRRPLLGVSVNRESTVYATFGAVYRDLSYLSSYFGKYIIRWFSLLL